jgi:hypothetical protein
MSLFPAFSIPRWTQATIAVIAILSQLKSLYDPSSFMTTYDIPSIPAAKLIGKTPHYLRIPDNPSRLYISISV